LFQQFGGSSPGGRSVHVRQCRDEEQVLAARQQRIKSGVLGRYADVASHLTRILDDIYPGDAPMPGIGQRQRGENANGRGFAGAVRPQKSED
jgi:hypothetical protein